MAIYAIADLHLSEKAEKPMDIFGGAWKGYRGKIIEGLHSLRLTPEDVIVIAGDFSWGIDLPEALCDFQFIDRFPGKKLLVKGNHDLWWETLSKMKKFFSENQITSIDFLHNNCYIHGNTALCGTRGWFFEEESGEAHDKKIMNREVMRLKASLDAVGGRAEKIFCFLHYPPLYSGYRCEPILDLFKQYGVSRCYYGHLHGNAHHIAKQGMADGTEYRLISADYLGFRPILVEKRAEA